MSKKEWFLTSQTHKPRDSCWLYHGSFLLCSSESTLIAETDKESGHIKAWG